jgi:hypothetical protein
MRKCFILLQGQIQHTLKTLDTNFSKLFLPSFMQMTSFHVELASESGVISYHVKTISRGYICLYFNERDRTKVEKNVLYIIALRQRYLQKM